jgi:hypothetical protein
LRQFGGIEFKVGGKTVEPDDIERATIRFHNEFPPERLLEVAGIRWMNHDGY